MPLAPGAEHLPERLEMLAPGGLVERDAQVIAIDQAQIDALLARQRRELRGPARQAQGKRVEIHRRDHLDATIR